MKPSPRVVLFAVGSGGWGHNYSNPNCNFGSTTRASERNLYSWSHVHSVDPGDDSNLDVWKRREIRSQRRSLLILLILLLVGDLRRLKLSSFEVESKHDKGCSQSGQFWTVVMDWQLLAFRQLLYPQHVRYDLVELPWRYILRPLRHLQQRQSPFLKAGGGPVQS